MSFLNLTKQRYSCRQYQSLPVEREKILRCLEAARWAPSACNSQPWHFIIVDERLTRDFLAEQAFGGIYRINAFAKQAPVLIAAVRQNSKYLAELAGRMRGVRYSLIDVGIACEHFVLQAQEEGLGTCWIGWFDAKKVKKVLKLPWHSKVDIIISVGYPRTNQKVEKKRRARSEIITFFNENQGESSQ